MFTKQKVRSQSPEKEKQPQITKDRNEENRRKNNIGFSQVAKRKKR